MEVKKRCRRYCSVPECRKRSGNMFRFPKDPIRRRLWEDACKIGKPITDTMDVCEDHFAKGDIKTTPKGRNRIGKGVVPTLKLPETHLPPKRGRRCAVFRCRNASSDDVTLHRFPRNHERRTAWQNVCKLLKPPNKDTRICSDHFSESDFYFIGNVKTLKRTHVMPSRHLPDADVLEERYSDYLLDSSCTSDDISNDSESSSSKSMIDCASSRKSEMSAVGSQNTPAKSLANEIESFIATDFCVTEMKTDVSEELTSLLRFVSVGIQVDSTALSHSAVHPAKLLPRPKKTILDLLETDADFIVFTGVSQSVLNCLCLRVKKCFRDSMNTVSLTTRIAITLCRLRMNLSFICLGILFNVDSHSCEEYFSVLIHKLATVLQCTIYLQSKKENLKNMPLHFQKFRDTRLVLDCTEVPVDTPNCLKHRIRMYSHCKGMFTVKFLLGVAPSGLISFISRVYGGRASDKQIFVESDLISKNLLEPNIDAVMVDKRFCINEICDMQGIKMYCPPFVVEKQQLNKELTVQNAEIACARVHVERLIQRMKEFKILQTKVCKETVPHIDDIVTVVGGLVNLSEQNLAEHFLTESDLTNVCS